MKIATAPSNVVILSTDNFDEVVMDKSKDVLVEFYAPWLVVCFSHCTLLIPLIFIRIVFDMYWLMYKLVYKV